MHRVVVTNSLALLTIALLALALAGCRSSSDRGQQVLARLPNPESGHGNFMDLSAEVVTEHYGPTTRDGTSVRLVSKEKTFFPYAEGKVFSYSGGNPQISINWRDANTLEVKCNGCLPDNIFWKVTKYEFVSVVYDQ